MSEGGLGDSGRIDLQLLADCLADSFWQSLRLRHICAGQVNPPHVITGRRPCLNASRILSVIHTLRSKSGGASGLRPRPWAGRDLGCSSLPGFLSPLCDNPFSGFRRHSWLTSLSKQRDVINSLSRFVWPGRKHIRRLLLSGRLSDGAVKRRLLQPSAHKSNTLLLAATGGDHRGRQISKFKVVFGVSCSSSEKKSKSDVLRCFHEQVSSSLHHLWSHKGTLNLLKASVLITVCERASNTEKWVLKHRH